jgi:hypothetical protein
MLQKDADPDIPILKEAKAEYAKLQYTDSDWIGTNFGAAHKTR